MDGTFDPTYSSNQIWVDTNVNECLTTHLDDMEDNRRLDVYNTYKVYVP